MTRGVRAAREAPIPAPVIPVILCGGSGERLWPASRPWRPKPFLTLVGDHSGFQAAAQRGAALAGAGDLLVLGGEAHSDLIAGQLAALGRTADILLEPVGRDTAAAVAVAAAWAARKTPGAVLAILPADHHVGDEAAFAAAVGEAAAAALADDVIVTLGLAPQHPSTAMGYIRPAHARGGVTPVTAFVEKPDSAAAAALIAEGALWNCGVFVARAATLLDEIRLWAPQIAEAACAAVDGAEALVSGALRLGPPLAQAPRAAFDRAVMERTARAAVLPVSFPWSDLGAWDAVLAADPARGVGAGGTVVDGAGVLVRAAPGMRVAVAGLSDVAVVAERDAVLVTSLGHSQGVRDLGAAVGPARPFADLAEAAATLDIWLRTAALPLWATVGVDAATGAFREALTWRGQPDDPRRRTRVQARQAFVFAQAAAQGLPGPWLRTARAGMTWFLTHARVGEGLFASALALDGAAEDPTPRLYEHAFVLLALAALATADPAERRWRDEAAGVRRALEGFRHADGGFREAGDAPFQANAQMHLLEAALAWEALDPDWQAVSDEVAGLAMSRLIDGQGVLHEIFDARWRPVTGDAGQVEPGHQFEWAWLLDRWGVERSVPAAHDAALRLFAVGRAGFDPARAVVTNAIRSDLSVRDAGARLWPQTEHLKAALALGESAAALEAANGLWAYLDLPVRGVWRERMRPDGAFSPASSPATSLYHLFVAVRELARASAEMC